MPLADAGLAVTADPPACAAATSGGGAARPRFCAGCCAVAASASVSCRPPTVLIGLEVPVHAALSARLRVIRSLGSGRNIGCTGLTGMSPSRTVRFRTLRAPGRSFHAFESGAVLACVNAGAALGFSACTPAAAARSSDADGVVARATTSCTRGTLLASAASPIAAVLSPAAAASGLECVTVAVLATGAGSGEPGVAAGDASVRAWVSSPLSPRPESSVDRPSNHGARAGGGCDTGAADGCCRGGRSCAASAAAGGAGLAGAAGLPDPDGACALALVELSFCALGCGPVAAVAPDVAATGRGAVMTAAGAAAALGA